MATPTPPQHNRKRQYQPSIDSFFHRHGSAVSDSSVLRPMSPMSPPLSAETQSSLLSVGMRVRKSVPEGYKTHKTMSVPGFRIPSTAPPTASAPVRPAYSSQTSRELTPFCGLHKTGGMAAQPSFPPPSSAPAALSDANRQLDFMPSLSMSQNTIATTQDSFTPVGSQLASKKRSRKKDDNSYSERSYEEDIEDDLDAYFDELEEGERASPVVHRLIAQPKGFRQKAASGPVAIMDDDFEDASFLKPIEDMDVDDRRF